MRSSRSPTRRCRPSVHASSRCSNAICRRPTPRRPAATRELARADQALEGETRDGLRAEFALKEADRRKDEFLAILAHELRNPLAPIRYPGAGLWRGSTEWSAVDLR